MLQDSKTTTVKIDTFHPEGRGSEVGSKIKMFFVRNSAKNFIFYFYNTVTSKRFRGKNLCKKLTFLSPTQEGGGGMRVTKGAENGRWGGGGI